jgi:hypothetical protein
MISRHGSQVLRPTAEPVSGAPPEEVGFGAVDAASVWGPLPESDAQGPRGGRRGQGAGGPRRCRSALASYSRIVPAPLIQGAGGLYLERDKSLNPSGPFELTVSDQPSKP